MDLEWFRKDAKRLVRGYRAGDADAVRRAEAVLGERAARRFQLSDAHHVIAVEQGHRSWPQLRRAVARRRVEDVIDAGLEYRPGARVRVRVIRRAQRVSVTDDGAAVALAGRPPRWSDIAAALERELDVNVSRQGVVSLPVVAVGPGEAAIVRRIGEASLTFHDRLLEAETEDGRLHSIDDDRRPRDTDRDALRRA